MKRREFLFNGAVLTGGSLFLSNYQLWANPFSSGEKNTDLYELFQNPDQKYRPFVRWWWNGDKVEKDELIRELHLLKEAGVGGVEINPVEFPPLAKDTNPPKPTLKWLSDEWINMLQVTFEEAKKLGMTCDLIVGSGWPFGAETLERDERAQIVILFAEKIEGPKNYETSRFNIFNTIDPGVTVSYPGRTFEILSLQLTPNPLTGLNQAIDLSSKIEDEVISLEIPEGNFVLYALVKVDSFASVINGAPGASGPILNHMDKTAVRKYLDHMSDTIQEKTGSLSSHLRAFFTDSMELEGCNWTNDFPHEFRKRRGYDLMPYLPFILFKVGRLGGVVSFDYGAEKSVELTEILNRVRFDFELTKAELLNERFTQTYLEWCNDQNVLSRAQSYGNGFFPLESSLGYDIPEGESWTTNWLKHKVGEEMPDDDYRRGRGYTMINKFVSSAAHLTGNQVVSCEEMTNTYLVFNTTPELLKIGSDQSILSGITHSVWHGFNYSPPDAEFPGWIQYGSYYNENNTLWPYFKFVNDYKARISSLLQNAVMYTDIAIFSAYNDMWSEMGVQTEPFPSKLNVPYTSLIWESIHKTGGGADYTSEIIIKKSEVKNGKLCFGPKKYDTLFLVEITSINPETLEKLFDFVSGGGRIFCIEKYPEKSLGLNNYNENDQKVQQWINKLKSFPDKFILVKKPTENKFLEWYSEIQKQYHIPTYLIIETPDLFVIQNRYQTEDGKEIFFFANASKQKEHSTKIIFSKEITKGKHPWKWNPESGEKYRIDFTENNEINLKLGPAESQIIVFDKQKSKEKWQAVSTVSEIKTEIKGPWNVEFVHCRGEELKPTTLEKIQDFKDIPEYVNFAGTIIYKNSFNCENSLPEYLNLGLVKGVVSVQLNGQDCGVKWYGNRIFPIKDKIKKDSNELEIRVVTVMVNYMKSLTDNTVAQYWTNEKNKIQPLSSLGLTEPVFIH